MVTSTLAAVVSVHVAWGGRLIDQISKQQQEIKRQHKLIDDLKADASRHALLKGGSAGNTMSAVPTTPGARPNGANGSNGTAGTPAAGSGQAPSHELTHLKCAVIEFMRASADDRCVHPTCIPSLLHMAVMVMVTHAEMTSHRPTPFVCVAARSRSGKCWLGQSRGSSTSPPGKSRTPSPTSALPPWTPSQKRSLSHLRGCFLRPLPGGLARKQSPAGGMGRPAARARGPGNHGKFPGVGPPGSGALPQEAMAYGLGLGPGPGRGALLSPG